MPELPEVETISRRLKHVLPGKKISTVKVFREKSFVGDASELHELTIKGVERRAKISIIILSNDNYLLVHLKMTGQLLYVAGDVRLGGGHPTADFLANLPSKHTRVSFTFTDETSLFFNDMRVFGWIKYVTPDQKSQLLGALAPDVIDDAFGATTLLTAIKNRTQSIKQVIMDSTVVAGVGNIYACDALHLAKISPFRMANSLSHEEATALVAAMKTVIQLGIQMGGASIQHYKNVEGLIGHYQDVRRVYAREGAPCGECGKLILRVKQAGRSTFYCAKCQK